MIEPGRLRLSRSLRQSLDSGFRRNDVRGACLLPLGCLTAMLPGHSYCVLKERGRPRWAKKTCSISAHFVSRPIFGGEGLVFVSPPSTDSGRRPVLAERGLSPFGPWWDVGLLIPHTHSGSLCFGAREREGLGKESVCASADEPNGREGIVPGRARGFAGVGRD